MCVVGYLILLPAIFTLACLFACYERAMTGVALLYTENYGLEEDIIKFKLHGRAPLYKHDTLKIFFFMSTTGHIHTHTNTRLYVRHILFIRIENNETRVDWQCVKARGRGTCVSTIHVLMPDRFHFLRLSFMYIHIATAALAAWNVQNVQMSLSNNAKEKVYK